ncbi:MAG: hypothetical protein HYY06_32040 [Deltaproteobacteria bacterium]|nr:hypothetical protein [Deltaproteobacteria bacterium]
MSDPDDSLRTNAVRNDPAHDAGASQRETDAVARFTRGMINGYTHELRGEFDIGRPPVTGEDVAAMEGLTADEVERAVRQNLPPALRTDENVRAIVDRLREGVGHVLADRVGEAARRRLESAERQLPLDARRTTSFLWNVAQSSRQDVAAARLEAMGMDRQDATATAQLLQRSDVRRVLRNGAVPDVLQPAAAALRQLAPQAAALLRSTRETFAESDPLRFGRLAWNEAKAMGEERTFVGDAARQAIHDHESEDHSEATGRFVGKLLATAAFGAPASAAGGATDSLLAHAEVLTQAAGVIAGISSPQALDHATHERRTTVAAALIGLGAGAVAGRLAEHAVEGFGLVIPKAVEGLTEATAEGLSHLGIELAGRRH